MSQTKYQRMETNKAKAKWWLTVSLVLITVSVWLGVFFRQENFAAALGTTGGLALIPAFFYFLAFIGDA